MSDGSSITKRLLGVDIWDSKRLDILSTTNNVRLFYNCLYLGQWHVAESCLTVQSFQRVSGSPRENSSQDESNIALLMRILVENPYCSSLGSSSVPTPHHLSWLAFQQPYMALPDDKRDVSGHLKRFVELRLLLVVLNKQIKSCQLKLDRGLSDEQLSKLSADMYKCAEFQLGDHSNIIPLLTEITCKVPTLGISLLATISLQHLYFDICVASLQRSVRNLIDLHQLPIGCRVPSKKFDDYLARFYKLLALFNPQEIDECQRKTVCAVFGEIVDALVVKKLPVDREKILSSLFGKIDSFILEKFCHLLWSADCAVLIERSLVMIPSIPVNLFLSSDVDTEGRSQSEYQDITQTSEDSASQKLAPSVRPDILQTTLMALTTTDRTLAWRQKYWLCLEHGRHVVDYILNLYNCLVDAEMFDCIRQIFTSTQFATLCHLAAVSYFDRRSPHSIEHAMNILKCALSINRHPRDTGALYSACCMLMRQQELTEWYNNIMSHLSVTSNSSSADLFRNLELKSGLGLLLSSGRLSDLKPDDVVKALESCPPASLSGEVDDTVDSKDRNRPAQTVEVSDSAKYLSFCVLNNLIRAILTGSMTSSSENRFSSVEEKDDDVLCCGTDVFSRISAAKSYADQIYPLSYRLEILENAFSLLFVRSSHVTTTPETPTDYSERDSESEMVEKKRDSRPRSRRSVGRDSPSIDENGRRISGGGGRKESTSVKSDSSGIEYGVTRLSSVGPLSSIASQDSDSVNSRASHGFVASADVIRAILSMLRDSMGVLIDKLNEPLSAGDKFSLCKQRENVTVREELQQRVIVLRRHVDDALWRLRMVSPLGQRATDASGSHPVDDQSHAGSGEFLSPPRQFKRQRMPTNMSMSGTVGRMLCSPENLLNICLREGRLQDASEVVKVCNLCDSPVSLEVDFVPVYQNLLARVKTDQSTRNDQKSAMPEVAHKIPFQPSIKDLSFLLPADDVAWNGDILAEFFRQNCAKFPSFSPDRVKLLSSCKHVSGNSDLFDGDMLRAMVSFDIAVVSGSSLDVSSNLLCSARSRLADVVSVRSSKLGFGIGKYADGLTAFLNAVLALSPPDGSSLAAMLTSVRDPITADGYRQFHRAKRRIKEVELRARDPFNDEKSANQNEQQSWENILQRLIVACRETLPPEGLASLISRSGGSSQSTAHWNYIAEFANGLSTLSDIVARHIPGTENLSYSQLLRRSPSYWLNELILVHDISPSSLQDTAEKLNVDLVHSIVSQMLLPASNVQSTENKETSQSDVIRLNTGKMVLNEAFFQHDTSSSSSDSRHPEVVTRSLLSRVIRHMKPWCNKEGILSEEQLQTLFVTERLDVVLSQTVSLCDVDMKLISDPSQQPERLCFYCNLISLLTLHALCVGIARRLRRQQPEVYQRMFSSTSPFWQTANSFFEDPLSHVIDSFPDHFVSRALYESIMAYRVGQLGIVSLYDLMYTIARTGFTAPPMNLGGLTKYRFISVTDFDPWRHHACPAEPLLAFTLFSPYELSPPLQVLHPELVQVSHETSIRRCFTRNMLMFVSQAVTFDARRLTVPPLLVDYTNEVDLSENDFKRRLLDTIVKLDPSHKELADAVANDESVGVNQVRQRAMEIRFDWYSSYRRPTVVKCEPSKSSRDMLTDKYRSFQVVYALTDPFSRSHPSTQNATSLIRALTDFYDDLSVGRISRLQAVDSSAKRCKLSAEVFSLLDSRSTILSTICALVADKSTVIPSSNSETKQESEGDDGGGSDGRVAQMNGNRFISDWCTGQSFSVLRNFLREYPAGLLSRSFESKEQLLTALCSQTIPEDVLSVLFQTYGDGRFQQQLYDCVLRLMFSDSDDTLLDDDKMKYVLDKLDVIPASAVSESVVLTALRDFIVVCSVLRGALPPLELMAVRDPSARCRLAVECAKLHRLETQTAYELLQSCISEPQNMDCKSLMRAWVLELTVQDCAGDSSPSHKTEMSLRSKIRQLCKQRKYELAHEYVDVCKCCEHRMVYEYHVSDLLLTGSLVNKVRANQVLEKLKGHSESGCLQLCRELCSRYVLADVGSVPVVQIVFATEFMISQLSHLLSDVESAELHTRIIGYRALQLMTEDIQKELMSHCRLPEVPLIMFEQLLMNEKIDCALTFVNTLRDYETTFGKVAKISLENCNRLVEQYARFAINISLSQTNNEPGSLLRSLTRASTMSELRVSRARSVIAELNMAAAAATTGGLTNSTTQTLHKSTTYSSSLSSVATESRLRMPARPPSRADWVPDTKSTSCTYCQQPFTMFNRRHHCRRCGRLLCHDCCSGELIVEGKPQRACNRCCEETEQQLKAGDAKTVVGLRKRLSSGVYSESVLSEWQYLLTTDERYNMTVREEFSYDHAPSCSLTMSILRLHTDIEECGRLIRNLVDGLISFIASASTTNSSSYDKNFVIQMVERLLVDAKLKFANEDYAESDVFDSYLHRLKVIKLLVANNCTIIPPISELGSFAKKSPAVSRMLRALINGGKFELALAICNACHLNKVELMYNWSLSGLRIGGSECMQSTRERIAQYYQIKQVLRKNDLKTDRLIADVIQVLTTSTENSLQAELSSIKLHLASSPDLLQCLSLYQPRPAVELDDIRYAECMYYLQTYGTFMQQLLFIKEWRGINAACVAFQKMKDASSDVFIRGLINPCLEEGSLSKLFASLKSVDFSLDSFRTHLVAACDYFIRARKYKVTYLLQELLQDYWKAAQTCIESLYASPIYVRYNLPLMASQDTESKVRCLQKAYNDLQESSISVYLEKAKRYLKLHAEQIEIRRKGQQLSTAAENVVREMSKVNFQMKLTDLLKKGQQKKVSQTSFTKTQSCLTFICKQHQLNSVPTVFGNDQSQCIAIQLMMILEYEAVGQQTTAAHAMTTLKLDSYAIVSGAACYLVRHLPLHDTFLKGFLPEMYQKIGVETMEQNSDNLYESLAQSLCDAEPGGVNSDLDCIKYLADQIRSPLKRYNVYMSSQMYERAFQCAVQLSDVSLVEQISACPDCKDKVKIKCQLYISARQSTSPTGGPDAQQQQQSAAGGSNSSGGRRSDW